MINYFPLKYLTEAIAQPDAFDIWLKQQLDHAVASVLDWQACASLAAQTIFTTWLAMCFT